MLRAHEHHTTTMFRDITCASSDHASRIGQNMLCVYLCFVSSNQMEIKITNKLLNAMQNLTTQALFEL
jgi:hypothetical protein